MALPSVPMTPFALKILIKLQTSPLLQLRSRTRVMDGGDDGNAAIGETELLPVILGDPEIDDVGEAAEEADDDGDLLLSTKTTRFMKLLVMDSSPVLVLLSSLTEASSVYTPPIHGSMLMLYIGKAIESDVCASRWRPYAYLRTSADLPFVEIKGR